MDHDDDLDEELLRVEEALQEQADSERRLAAEVFVAETHDGLVRVTVAGTSGLRDLSIEPEAMRSYTADGLAQALLETLREASEAASAHFYASFPGLLPPVTAASEPVEPAADHPGPEDPAPLGRAAPAQLTAWSQRS